MNKNKALGTEVGRVHSALRGLDWSLYVTGDYNSALLEQRMDSKLAGLGLCSSRALIKESRRDG